MSWTAVLEVVAPVFLLAALGYAFGTFRPVDLSALTEIVVWLAAPALIFDSLASGPLAGAEMVVLAVGAAAIVLGVGLIVFVVSRAAGQKPGALYLPAMFMNSGNMLLPLSLLAFGEEGLRRSVVIFVTVSILNVSLGITIAHGRLASREMFRLPYIYAVALALAVRAGWFQLWGPLGEAVELLGAMAIPAMLLALGLRLRSVEIVSWTKPALIAAARLGGGYAVALAFVASTGLEGTSRDCLLLAGVMPSAVVNFVFAERYGNRPGDVATAIAVSTLASLVTTPLVLAYGL